MILVGRIEASGIVISHSFLPAWQHAEQQRELREDMAAGSIFTNVSCINTSGRAEDAGECGSWAPRERDEIYADHLMRWTGRGNSFFLLHDGAGPAPAGPVFYFGPDYIDSNFF